MWSLRRAFSSILPCYISCVSWIVEKVVKPHTRIDLLNRNPTRRESEKSLGNSRGSGRSKRGSGRPETLRIPKGILSILVVSNSCECCKISASAHLEYSLGNLKGSAVFNGSKNRRFGYLLPLEKVVEIDFPG